MRSGRLRHRIILKSPVQTPDGKGGVTESWETFATVWASIEPLKGREFYEAQAINSEITGKMVMRYLAGMKSHIKAVLGSREFDILAVINVEEKNREQNLMYKELVIA